VDLYLGTMIERRSKNRKRYGMRLPVLMVSVDNELGGG
jgi:hypothetical protein